MKGDQRNPQVLYLTVHCIKYQLQKPLKLLCTSDSGWALTWVQPQWIRNVQYRDDQEGKWCKWSPLPAQLTLSQPPFFKSLQLSSGWCAGNHQAFPAGREHGDCETSPTEKLIQCFTSLTHVFFSPLKETKAYFSRFYLCTKYILHLCAFLANTVTFCFH